MNRVDLAQFLKSRRARLSPTTVGLPEGPRRRTPGLRRQEVAQLARISVDYYIRLEQARGPNPSRQVLNALGRALLLDIDERAHLFHLAGETPAPSARLCRDVAPQTWDLLGSFTEVPAHVTDAKYDLLGSNRFARALLAGVPAPLCRGTNVVRMMFDSPDAARRLADPVVARFARCLVADLRAASARYPDDPELAALIAELLRTGPEFGEIWAEHEVRVHRVTRKQLKHSRFGDLRMDCHVLPLPDSDQRLILYVAAPESPARRAFRQLAAELADSSSNTLITELSTG